MNLNKFVDSLDTNELKKLLSLVQNKVEKSEEEKARNMLSQAMLNYTPVDLFGMKLRIVKENQNFGYNNTHSFEFEGGSVVVFQLD